MHTICDMSTASPHTHGHGRRERCNPEVAAYSIKSQAPNPCPPLAQSQTHATHAHGARATRSACNVYEVLSTCKVDRIAAALSALPHPSCCSYMANPLSLQNISVAPPAVTPYISRPVHLREPQLACWPRVHPRASSPALCVIKTLPRPSFAIISAAVEGVCRSHREPYHDRCSHQRPRAAHRLRHLGEALRRVRRPDCEATPLEVALHLVEASLGEGGGR